MTQAGLEQRPGLSPVTVIIPALNEEQSLPLVLRDIPREPGLKIIVVDNGSTDRTAEVARESGAVVLSEPRRGYGYACLRGIDHALARQPAVFVFLDADYSDHPEEMQSILAPIRERGCDLVIGSRTLGHREPGAMLPQALVGNWIATRLIMLFWGQRFTDLGPFRAIRADALQRMQMSDKTYGWTVEMQIKAAKLGMSCAEVPVSYRRRIGTSKVTGTLTGTVNASVKILATIARYMFVRV